MADTGRGIGELEVEPSLNRLLGQVERRICRLLEPILIVEGLTVDQWRVLDLLSDGAGHPMSEIAARIVVPGPTLTKLIDKLVDAAAVYRLVDGRDRRRVLAFISDDGRDLHARLLPQVAEAEASALAVLGAGAPKLLEILSGLVDDQVGPRHEDPLMPPS